MRPDKKRELFTAVLGPILFAGSATAIMARNMSHGDQTSEVNLDGNVAWTGMSVLPPGTTGNFVVFDAPNAYATLARSINADGDVTGYFVSLTRSGSHGFVRHHNGAFAVFDAPDALYTEPHSINAGGEVAGRFIVGQFNAPGWVSHGFVRDRTGNIAVFDGPDALYTEAWSINDRGDVAGYFQDGQGYHGFVRDRDGNFTVIDPPNAVASLGTFVQSINNSGDVPGYFYQAGQGYRARGFVWDRRVVWSGVSVLPPGTNRNFTVFDVPNALGTYVLSINAREEVAGWFPDASPPYKERGFVRERDGDITIFDAPNSSNMRPASINARGEVAGWFADASQAYRERGFVRDSKGNITVFDAPNALYTEAWSINDRGDVAGWFNDPIHSKLRGFVRHRGPYENKQE